MGWFGRLFGTKKAIDSIVDKDNGLLSQVGGWVGNFNYTEEERAEMDAKTREWGLNQLEALQPFKITQRVLAFCATGLWLFVAVNLAVMIWIDHPRLGEMIKFALSDYVWMPVSGVYILYFGGGAVESFFRGRKGA